MRNTSSRLVKRISAGLAAVLFAGATFGAVAAAGELATALGIAPWPAGEAEGFEMTVDLANADIPVAGGFGAGSTLVDARLEAIDEGTHLSMWLGSDAPRLQALVGEHLAAVE